MDAKKITEDYHDWHNIAKLRLLGLSRSQIAKKLQLPPGRVMRLSRLNVDELLQHGNRPRPSYSCRLDPYEESVKHLLITCPYYSSTQIHEYLKENNPSFPKVCEKTVFNYVKKYVKDTIYLQEYKFFAATIFCSEFNKNLNCILITEI